ncbi:MAG: hypothetical protein H6626_05770 [Pseudobdellovibrionaceae bacterium]|nr:hypothetical protein [Bdellovibrionales bacterium]USN48602.1 MAG: hypothetical protein H6626_05770 [Pseudobdellovibrionaceae bacterium]
MDKAIDLKAYKQAKGITEIVKKVESTTLSTLEVYRQVIEMREGKRERQISHKKSK